MAAKPVEIHPAALAEWKSALNWYLERSDAVALKFVAEVDRAIGLVAD
jgi:isopenicillin N synthase-like dioxygenase